MACRIDNYICTTLLIGSLLLQYHSPLNSQQEEYRMELIPLTGELINFSGTSLFQDNEGFMWFGSTDGPYRYDGKDLKRFQNDPFDKSSLLGNHIKDIVEDWLSLPGQKRTPSKSCT
jgi:ligand-binding sensor domain-containing protein